MVWLHGGGFSSGSGSSPTDEGVYLCCGADVVVTINHRLNIFGSLHLEGLAGNEFAASGCVGMLDVVATLKWVRDNIAQVRRRSRRGRDLWRVGRWPKGVDPARHVGGHGSVSPCNHRERRGPPATQHRRCHARGGTGTGGAPGVCRRVRAGRANRRDDRQSPGAGRHAPAGSPIRSDRDRHLGRRAGPRRLQPD